MGLKIGNTELAHGLILAPMAGFTDRAMRLVSKEWGAEYTVTEMVSAKAVVFGDKKTHILARIREDESPAAVQIFGSEPGVMAKAAEMLSRGEDGGVPPASIDINMGCPVKKVFSNGEGSALMKDPDLIFKIVKAVKENTDLPTTVKMRLGIDSESINVRECALAAEAAGAALVAVHGRTRAEMYKGTANMELIKNVKRALHIPLIANGDVIDAESCAGAFLTSGADGVMIGRGAIGNPFIFSEIKARLLGKSYEQPNLETRVNTALSQLRYAIEDKGEAVAVREARGQIAFYITGFRGASAVRAMINRESTYCGVEKIFDSLLQDNLKEKL